MNTEALIETYFSGVTGSKGDDLRAIHSLVLCLKPGVELWFLDGKNEAGKTVANPNIGYGRQTLRYANGSTKEFYRVGISANTTGISVYILSLDDKSYLAQTFGPNLGKASITGYCIKFKKLSDVDLGVLQEAIQCGFDSIA
jgi:hypothetical protein